jgi:hypothetical protein
VRRRLNFRRMAADRYYRFITPKFHHLFGHLAATRLAVVGIVRGQAIKIPSRVTASLSTPSASCICGLAPQSPVRGTPLVAVAGCCLFIVF